MKIPEEKEYYVQDESDAPYEDWEKRPDVPEEELDRIMELVMRKCGMLSDDQKMEDLYEEDKE